MERQFNLIKTDYQEIEKRILPRFPFSFLMFKCARDGKIFQVSDISYTGMQVSLKNGEHNLTKDDQVKGNINWAGTEIEVTGKIMWVKDQNAGISFEESVSEQIKDFFCVDSIVKSLKPMHENGAMLNIPSNLRYWLRADGPLEIFVWKHSHGDFSKIQFILLDVFVEWEDGKGVKTGKVVNKRDIETPLFSEDEFAFLLDEGADFEKINFAKEILALIDDKLMSESSLNFIKLKLGM